MSDTEQKESGKKDAKSLKDAHIKQQAALEDLLAKVRPGEAGALHRLLEILAKKLA